jgi:hypothetical protein
MSRPSNDDPLLLLRQKAVYDISAILSNAPNGVSSRQIEAATRRNPMPVLRELAVSGFVRRNGSWDTPPDEHTVFTLTRHGHRLRRQLDRLDQWARGRID